MAIKVGTKARTMRKITMMVLVTLKKGNVKKLRFGREKDKFENQLALIKIVKVMLVIEARAT